MFVVPVSGFVYVMAGGYGVHLFGVWHMPAVLPQWAALADIAKATHIVSNIALLAALATHIGLVLRHQWHLKDGLLRRML
jgi:cytochrome b561